MDAPRLLEFLRRHRVAVEASVSAGRGAQTAVVGVEEPSGVELERLKQTYYAVYPGRAEPLELAGADLCAGAADLDPVQRLHAGSTADRRVHGGTAGEVTGTSEGGSSRCLDMTS